MRGNQKSVVRALIEVNGTVMIPLSYIQSICIVESQLVIINVNFVLNSADPQEENKIKSSLSVFPFHLIN